MPLKDPEARRAYQKQYHINTYPYKGKDRSGVRKKWENPNLDGRTTLWHDDTHAECKNCHERLPKENYHNAFRGGRAPWKKGKRNVGGTCKPCKYKLRSTPEYLAMRRKQDRKRRLKLSIEELSYKSYTYKVGKDNVDITLEEWCEDYFPKDGICPYFHLKLKNYAGTRRKGDPIPLDSPSIDRIDNKKGYIKGNMEVTSWAWNRAKKDLSLEEMFVVGKFAAIKLGYRWPPEPA